MVCTYAGSRYLAGGIEVTNENQNRVRNVFQYAISMLRSNLALEIAGLKSSLPDVVIPTEVPIAILRFTDFFKGFEKIPAVREIFGQDTEKVLSELRVEFFSSKFGYMGVSDEDGHLIVSAYYLKNGDQTSKYLDVVHELVHVRQHREGKELFDEAFEYNDRPTELEAYAHSVKEARRLGMSDQQIFEYLKVDWLEDEEVRKLARNLGVTPPRRVRAERVR